MIDIESLFKSQFEYWPAAIGNYISLSKTKDKEFVDRGQRYRMVHNPARIRSSAAKVDAESIAARPCFLCHSNRIPGQKAIEWNGYEILVNPFPIFNRHLTIVEQKHVPQRISGRLYDMLSLAIELNGYAVLYNGPAAGASAPDHFHFQACMINELPLFEYLRQYELKGMSVVDRHPPVIVLSGSATERESLVRDAERVIGCLPKGNADEPRMNVLVAKIGEQLYVVIVPRGRHFPLTYGFGQEDYLIAPAVVDMGGVMVVPRQCDFDRLGKDGMLQMLDEVGMGIDDIKKLL